MKKTYVQASPEAEDFLNFWCNGEVNGQGYAVDAPEARKIAELFGYCLPLKVWEEVDRILAYWEWQEEEAMKVHKGWG